MNSQKTALYERHLACGAKMGPFAEWQMPLTYQGLKEEVYAVRNHAGIFDVSHMGEFLIEGERAASFVDYLLPNAFEKASDSSAVYSPLCRENGTIIDDLIAYKISTTRVLLCVNASNIDKDKEWILKRLKTCPWGEELSFQDLSAKYALLALQGPKALNYLEKIFPEQAIPSRFSINRVSDELIIARTGYTGEEGVEIFCTPEQAQKIWDASLEMGVTPCGLGARDCLRLEACFPLYGQELNDDVTPLESSLAWTVKTQEREFIGKEALLNTEKKWMLVKLSCDKAQGILRQGFDVCDEEGKIVGVTTSGIYSPTFERCIALARVNIAAQKKENFSVQIRKNLVKTTRHRKSFLNEWREKND